MRRHRSGMSLLEIVVAMGILVIVLLALVSATLSSQQVDALAQERHYVAQAAATRLDDVLSEAWDDLPTRNGETFDIGGENEVGQFSSIVPTATTRTQAGLVTVSSAPTADMLIVEVSVAWHSVVGNDIEYSVSTLVAKH